MAGQVAQASAPFVEVGVFPAGDQLIFHRGRAAIYSRVNGIVKIAL
jgi:hypothetical protein